MDNGPDGWLGVDGAASAYGISARTMRRWIASSKVQAVKVATPSGHEWRVQPPIDSIAHDQGDQGDQAAPGDAGPGLGLIRVSDAERLLAPIVQERDRLAAELERLHDARLADAELIGRLKQEIETMRAQQPPPTPQARPDRPRQRWPWQRK